MRAYSWGSAYAEFQESVKGTITPGKLADLVMLFVEAQRGFDLVEVSPANDLRNITSMLGARLILNLIGALAHEGQIGR